MGMTMEEFERMLKTPHEPADGECPHCGCTEFGAEEVQIGHDGYLSMTGSNVFTGGQLPTTKRKYCLECERVIK